MCSSLNHLADLGLIDGLSGDDEGNAALLARLAGVGLLGVDAENVTLRLGACKPGRLLVEKVLNTIGLKSAEAIRNVIGRGLVGRVLVGKQAASSASDVHGD